MGGLVVGWLQTMGGRRGKGIRKVKRQKYPGAGLALILITACKRLTDTNTMFPYIYGKTRTIGTDTF